MTQVTLKLLRKAIDSIITDDGSSKEKNISSLKMLRLSVEEKLKQPRNSLRKFLKANREAKDLFRQTIRSQKMVGVTSRLGIAMTMIFLVVVAKTMKGKKSAIASRSLLPILPMTHPNEDCCVKKPVISKKLHPKSGKLGTKDKLH